MNEPLKILFPVGRIVSGSPLTPQTKDRDGNPCDPKYYIGVAIKKNGEAHWNQTDWGAKVYDEAKKAFNINVISSSSFAWKIKDGDSTDIVGQKSQRWCDKEGYPGHWVLNFSSKFAPQITDSHGKYQEYLTKADAINAGDYVQVFANIVPNNIKGPVQTSGMYFNHEIIGFSGYGKRIITIPIADPQEVFKNGVAQHPDASPTPLGGEMENAAGVETATVAQPQPQAEPYPQILTPPPPPLAAPAPMQKILNATAPAGYTYDKLIAAGWNDDQIRAQGWLS